jgi:dipeptidyl aminopeptidase/acylaminoacyl peptidase
VGALLLWTPDGQRIAFNQILGRLNRQDVLWQRADGSAPPEVLARDAGSLCSWSPDGQRLATVKDGDIWVATLDGSKATLERVTDTPHLEVHPEFSPDGRWLAYSSDESGRREVYVQPWPGPGPRQQVSVEGGASPAWNPNGREIFFLGQFVPGPPYCRAMMVVDVKLEPTLQLGRPRVLFEWARGCPDVRSHPLLRRRPRRATVLQDRTLARSRTLPRHAHPPRPELDRGAEGPCAAERSPVVPRLQPARADRGDYAAIRAG